MTYNDLAALLDKMSPEELAQDVTVYLTEEDEYIPANSFRVCQEDGILDPGHYVLSVIF